LSWTLEGERLRSVLVTRLRYLGDIVMSTVVLEVLRRGDPDLELGYLCEDAGVPLLRGHPRVTRVHGLSSRRRGPDADARRDADGRASPRGAGFWSSVRDLRRRRYDLAVDLFFNPRSAWLVRLAGTRFRIGGSRGARSRLFTHAVNAPAESVDPTFRRAAPGGLGEHLGRLLPLRHELSGLDFRDWYLETYPEGLRPTLPVFTPTDTARRALDAAGVSEDGGFTLLVPGATWPSKAWSPGNWRRLARDLVDDGRGPVVMLSPPDGGGQYRSALAGAGLSGESCLPPLPLAEALSVVARSGTVITVDGGLMHAAVALGRPTVALLGPTDPEIWFPYAGLGPYRALCARPDCHPCDRHDCDDFVCMPTIDPEQVVAAVAGLDGPGGGRS